MNRRTKNNLGAIGLCMIMVLFYYTRPQIEVEEKKKPAPTTYQNVVFKDESDTLIPVEVAIPEGLEMEQIVRTTLDTMQSSQYTELGLQPVLAASLQLESYDFKEGVMTLNFNDSLVANTNQEALDIIESLAYVLFLEGVHEINLQVEGKAVSVIPNSSIPVSVLHKDIGINNFESSTNNLFLTVPVVVYNTKRIKEKVYYVPTTVRLEVEQNDLSMQVSKLLSYLKTSTPIELVEVNMLQDGILQVSLSSAVLQDNEQINPIVFDQLTKSLQSIPNCTNVQLYVDGVLQEKNQTVSLNINNRLQ